MNRDAIHDAVLGTIHVLAPETQGRLIEPGAALRQVVELDSMDWLNVFTAIEQKLGIDIPPRDHASLASLDAIVDYAAAKRPHSALPGHPSSQPPLPSAEFVVKGTRVCIRPMRDDDEALQAEFVRHLSSTSRYQRFMVSMNALPQSKLDALTHVDQSHHVALVAEPADEGERKLVGVARYVVDGTGLACEYAVAIDDAWQGSGLAGLLMHTLIGIARARGLRKMQGLVLRANDKMLKLCRQLGFTQEVDPADHQTVHVALAL